MKSLTSSLILFFFAAASAQAGLCDPELPPAPGTRVGHESSGGRPIPLSLTLEFSSLGNGIDTASLEASLSYIAENIQNGAIAKILSKTQGREGERKICLQFSELQNSFRARNELKDVICSVRNQSRAEPTLTVGLRCDDAEYGVPGLPVAQ